MIPRRGPAGASRIEGRGLFSGAPATCEIRSEGAGNEAEAGIRFERADLANPPRVRAHVDHAIEEPAPEASGSVRLGARNTTLRLTGGATIATVEHVLSALAGLGVTDAVVSVRGPEIPLADGSSAPFASAIRERGLIGMDGEAEPIRPARRIEVHDGRGAEVTIEPAPSAEYVYELDYGSDAPFVPAQAAWWGGDPDEYLDQIAPARTFCLVREAEAMRAAGHFEHLSARDVVVLAPGGPVDNELRFDNEPARHKLLDLIGDFALAGAPLLARVIARRSGHALHREAVRRLLDDASHP